MSGRGDNNQHGSAGRGARNESNQRFAGDGKHEPASDHHKHSDRLQTLNLTVDGVPYVVETEMFLFNDEERYNVRVNGGPDHVYVWDSEVRRLRALDDDAVAEVPDALEERISSSLLR